ncbi:hypothetical protein [Acetobacter sp.]|jgi:alkanesulfonate monooxygenase SsuD/methylene tetrahydromethanopterin reductase-like flavin-dependent oxidoreductase (luciferase family)|uniref:hypothetical protein n=1 Tax=Acetobacter sp. TaxID=440 RepID=UPI0025B8E66B|nr:hypothetical protein [Acetobacter sp.]MCH4091219.1 hypothetical protein [Acetobacter sp.]MCI1300886.1 hypothetical protein [Acetobacter sp.]MCI1317214.1 hypothetical protein [Acetobacter sp.]
MEEALALYRQCFESSERLPKSCAMLAVNAIIGEILTEAQHAATSLEQHFVALCRGCPTQFPASRSVLWSEQEQAFINRTLRYMFTGTADVVAARISAFIQQYQPDEFMIGPLFSQAARRRPLPGLHRD